MRNSVVAIFVSSSKGNLLHFCAHDVLSGSNYNIWFPIFDEKNLFKEIENIMINCRVANNVTLIERIRSGENKDSRFADYQITYNEI